MESIIEKAIKEKRPLNYQLCRDENYEYGFYETDYHTYGIFMKRIGWLNMVSVEHCFDLEYNWDEMFEEGKLDVINDIEEEIMTVLKDEAECAYIRTWGI